MARHREEYLCLDSPHNPAVIDKTISPMTELSIKMDRMIAVTLMKPERLLEFMTLPPEV
jgi:hypothetical protein